MFLVYAYLGICFVCNCYESVIFQFFILTLLVWLVEGIGHHQHQINLLY